MEIQRCCDGRSKLCTQVPLRLLLPLSLYISTASVHHSPSVVSSPSILSLLSQSSSCCAQHPDTTIPYPLTNTPALTGLHRQYFSPRLGWLVSTRTRLFRRHSPSHTACHQPSFHKPTLLISKLQLTDTFPSHINLPCVRGQVTFAYLSAPPRELRTPQPRNSTKPWHETLPPAHSSASQALTCVSSQTSRYLSPRHHAPQTVYPVCYRTSPVVPTRWASDRVWSKMILACCCSDRSYDRHG